MVDEIKTETKTSEITKSDSESLIAQILKQNQEQTTALIKSQTDILEAIKKMQDSNPVAHGTSAESKPKVEDTSDVGDKEKNTASYAPDGDAQASIRTPAGKPSGTDSLSKSDDEKKEEKKEDKEAVEKSEDMKKSIVASDGYSYEIVKAVRPKIGILPENPVNAPTGYQLIKAINSGFGGKFDTYEKAFIHAYENTLAGKYGTGNPGGF